VKRMSRKRTQPKFIQNFNFISKKFHKLNFKKQNGSMKLLINFVLKINDRMRGKMKKLFIKGTSNTKDEMKCKIEFGRKYPVLIFHQTIHFCIFSCLLSINN